MISTKPIGEYIKTLSSESDRTHAVWAYALVLEAHQISTLPQFKGLTPEVCQLESVGPCTVCAESKERPYTLCLKDKEGRANFGMRFCKTHFKEIAKHINLSAVTSRGDGGTMTDERTKGEQPRQYT